jgi:hypothetical protein
MTSSPQETVASPDPGKRSEGVRSPGSTDVPLALEWMFLAVGAVVIAALWDSHGVAWDDSIQARYGEDILAYFLSLGRNRAATDHELLRMYTALPDLLAAAVYSVAPELKHPVRSTVTALFGLLSVPALFRLARAVGAQWAGPLAALGLLTMPVFFGHAFINSKDLPLAAAFAWAVLALVSFVRAGRDVPWRTTVLCGLGLGLPLTIRPGTWPILMFLFLALAAFANLVERSRLPPLRHAATLVALSWGVMVLLWPWAHGNPLANPLAAMAVANAFPTVVPVLFDGSVVSSDQLPRRYLLYMLGVKTPIALLLLGLLGALVGGARILRERASENLGRWVCLLWLVAPLAAWTLLTPNIYDGVRHFLFVLPALALWAGVGAVWAMDALGTSRLGYRSSAALVVLLLAFPVGDLIRLHPYEMTYFNRIVGGTRGAADRFETDYWVTSYREAAEWIASRPGLENGPVRVLVAANQLSEASASAFLPEHFEVQTTLSPPKTSTLPDAYDFYLATTRFGMADRFPDTPIVYTVGRDGAVFAVVRGLPQD